MSQRYRKASITLLFTGAALSLGSGFVVVAPSLARVITAAHPMHEAAAWGKPSVTRDDPARVLALLEAIDAVDADAIIKANLLVSSAMTSYWPALGVHDATLDCGFLEDPAEWYRQRYLGGAEELVSGFTQHQTLERGDWRMALRKGVGFCSQQAMVLAGFLKERGIDAEVHGLGGHVITVAHTADGDILLDPDYGVALRCSLEQAQTDPERVRAAYLAAGFGAAQTDMVVEIYGVEKNAIYNSVHLKPAESRKSAVPSMVFFGGIVMMLAGVFGLRRSKM